MELLEGQPLDRLISASGLPTDRIIEIARKKLTAKSLDAIVVNDVSRDGVGFDSDRNAVTIISHENVVDVPETTKWEVAQRVLDEVVRLRKSFALKH
jgi:phosphopantothenoylcysteine decarboxylase/phosphopantothenate--cysteine ligase